MAELRIGDKVACAEGTGTVTAAWEDGQAYVTVRMDAWPDYPVSGVASCWDEAPEPATGSDER